MRLSQLRELLRGAKMVTVQRLVFQQPAAKGLRFLKGIGARYDAEAGGYVLVVREPGTQVGEATRYKLAHPGRFTWVQVRRGDDELLQIDGWG